MEDIFKFPKKWCITTTKETNDIILEWLFKHTSYKNSESIDKSVGNHYCVEDYNCSGWMKNYPGRKEGYTEINFEQFQAIVNKKRIIGYKLIKPEYAKAAIDIEGNRCIGNNILKEQILKAEYIESVNKLKDAGVLDLWFEPVYENISKFKIGDYVRWNGDKACVGIIKDVDWEWDQENYILEHTSINDIYDSCNVNFLEKISKEEYLSERFHVKIKGYNAVFTHNKVTFGCKTYTKEFVLTLAKCLEDNSFEMDYKDEIIKMANYFKRI